MSQAHVGGERRVLLDGRVALVTGAGSGIGRGTALRLATEGARVVVADVEEATAKETAAMIAQEGGHAMAFHIDVTYRKSVREMVTAVCDEWEGIDILHNNAGVLRRSSFLDARIEDFDYQLDVNLRGLFHVGQEVAQSMVRRGRGGRIVNTCSMVAFIGVKGISQYSATKGAVMQLTKSMALELGQHGIQVNAVAPGIIETGINTDNQNNGAYAAAMHRIPLGRIGVPADIAEVVLFLASPAVSYITGAIIPVDGGFLTN